MEEIKRAQVWNLNIRSIDRRDAHIQNADGVREVALHLNEWRYHITAPEALFMKVCIGLVIHSKVEGYVDLTLTAGETTMGDWN